MESSDSKSPKGKWAQWMSKLEDIGPERLRIAYMYGIIACIGLIVLDMLFNHFGYESAFQSPFYILPVSLEFIFIAFRWYLIHKKIM